MNLPLFALGSLQDFSFGLLIFALLATDSFAQSPDGISKTHRQP